VDKQSIFRMRKVRITSPSARVAAIDVWWVLLRVAASKRSSICRGPCRTCLCARWESPVYEYSYVNLGDGGSTNVLAQSMVGGIGYAPASFTATSSKLDLSRRPERLEHQI